jgi:hypothetical protein
MINYDYENCPWYSKINDPPATIPWCNKYDKLCDMCKESNNDIFYGVSETDKNNGLLLLLLTTLFNDHERTKEEEK